jgi:hypothetical protein
MKSWVVMVIDPSIWREMLAVARAGIRAGIVARWSVRRPLRNGNGADPAARAFRIRARQVISSSR